MDKHLKCPRYRIADYTKSARFFFRFGISKILSHRVFVIRSVVLFLFFAMIMYTENWSPKRWHINDTRRTIMADTEIALRIDISIRRPFSIFRANEKKERKEKFSFLIKYSPIDRSFLHRIRTFSRFSSRKYDSIRSLLNRFE